MRRLLLLVAALSLLAAPAAVAAGKPTPRDRTDARTMVAAAKGLETAHKSAIQTFAERWGTALVGCPAWGELPEEQQEPVLDALFEEVAVAAFVPFVLPGYRQYLARLQRVKPHDPALKAGLAVVVQRTRADLALGWERLPQIDVCAVLTQWAETGYEESFDLLAAAGIDRALYERLFRDRPPTAAQRRTLAALETRLRACGVSRADAARFRP